jgi:Ca2+-binding EF-hand superfamily protein
MYIEEKIIQENIFTKEHIDELYNLFVVLSENSRFNIIPNHFINTFQNITDKKLLNVDKEIWTQIFFQIDHDKDGGISFQDFVRFISIHLKLIFGEVGDKISINKIR